MNSEKQMTNIIENFEHESRVTSRKELKKKQKKKAQESFTVCPESSDPFYIVSYYIKWVTTSWTHSTSGCSSLPLPQTGSGGGVGGSGGST